MTEVNCPVCEKNDLLVSLSFTGSALDYAKRFQAVEQSGSDPQSVDLFIFPESCPTCGAQVSDTGSTGTTSLRCAYCRARINPEGIMQVPRTRPANLADLVPKHILGIADDFFKQDRRLDGVAQLRNYLEIPTGDSDGSQAILGQLLFAVSLLLLIISVSGRAPFNAILPTVVIMVSGFAYLIFVSVTENSSPENFDQKQSPSNLFKTRMRVIERSYFCFRDDICYDPVGGYTWLPKHTSVVFQDAENVDD